MAPMTWSTPVTAHMAHPLIPSTMSSTIGSVVGQPVFGTPVTIGDGSGYRNFNSFTPQELDQMERGLALLRLQEQSGLVNTTLAYANQPVLSTGGVPLLTSGYAPPYGTVVPWPGLPPPQSNNNNRGDRYSFRMAEFDPAKESFESFEDRFAECVKHYQWEGSDKLFYLKQCIATSINSVLWSGGKVNSAEELLSRLKSRYGKTKQTDRYQMELRLLRRKKGDTIYTIYDTIKRLSALAWSGEENAKHVVSSNISTFAEVIESPATRKEILLRRPQTLEDALDVASNMEFIEAYDRESSDVYDPDGRKRDKAHARSADAQVSAVTSVDPRDTAMAILRKELDEMKAWKAEQQASKARYIANKGKFQGKGSPRGGSQGPRLCCNCQQPGHFKDRCPNPPVAGSTPTPVPTSKPPHASVKGVAWDSGHPQTYIEADIGGKIVHCLLDTGCDKSLLPRKYIPDVPVQPVTVNVFAANGNPIPVLGSTRMHFKINGTALTADFLVTDDVDEIMLGYDWLEIQGCRWHFDEYSIILHGMTVPLHNRVSRISCKRVYIRDDVSIPPNTEINVPVRLVKTSFRTPPGSWVMGPTSFAHQVFSARVLLPEEDTHAAFRIANLSEKEFFLEGGRSVGHALLGQITGSVPDSALPCRAFQSSCEEPDSTYLKPVIDSLSETLSAEERDEACKLIYSYRDVFSKHEYDLGRTNLMEHQIETGDARPIREGLRKQPQIHLDVIDAEIDKMAVSGVIEPSCSPWASNVVVVTKHDKTPRITLDYRKLNGVTYKDSYPLPNISDCLDAFRGSSFFGLLDLRSSFYQVPLAEKDRDKTAFITRRGQWRFRSLPMGLSNSPGTFQRLMDLVLRGMTWSSVLVYIDDIVVYGKSFSALWERLKEVFEG